MLSFLWNVSGLIQWEVVCDRINCHTKFAQCCRLVASCVVHIHFYSWLSYINYDFFLLRFVHAPINSKMHNLNGKQASVVKHQFFSCWGICIPLNKCIIIKGWIFFSVRGSYFSQKWNKKKKKTFLLIFTRGVNNCGRHCTLKMKGCLSLTLLLTFVWDKGYWCCHLSCFLLLW